MDISLLIVFGVLSVSNAQQGHMNHGAHSVPAAGPGPAQRSCRPGWERNSDPETGHATCLWYSDVEATFTDAWIWCSVLNAHPTAVFSETMQGGLCLSSKLRHKGKYWLGITDMESRGRYKLAYNGEPVTYFTFRTWIPGKPSTSLQNRCIYLDNDKCQLSDDACTAKHRFICQDHY